MDAHPEASLGDIYDNVPRVVLNVEGNLVASSPARADITMPSHCACPITNYCSSPGACPC